jgi:hypothetical protein
MDFSIYADETIRTVQLRLNCAPIMDGSSYRRRPRRFQPQIVTIRTGKDFFSVQTDGPILLNSGTTSDNSTDKLYWYDNDHFRKEAPTWLVDLVAEVMG